ncbi:sensor histidine kinase [Luteimonas sp. e5]
MAPQKSLSRKIRWIFILQGLIASVLVTAGTFYGSMLLRDSLLKQRLVNEVDRTWQLLAQDPRARLAESATIRSYFVPSGAMPDAVPPQLRALSPGLHNVHDGDWRVAYVSQRAEGVVFVQAAPGATDGLVARVAVLAALLSVLSVILLSLLGYRRCKRIVAPISRLTDRVLAWDPRRDQVVDYDVAELGGEGTYEVDHLGDALTRMSRRMLDHVERERDFTRDASHELRTPVSVVRVASDLLASEDLSPRGERSLRRIRDATGDMQELIDAFLILARHPDVPVESERVRVQDVAHEEAANVEYWLQGKDVRMLVLTTADPYIEAPPRVLGVIISQFLRNACRFTEQGSIELEVLADRLEVRDTGIGMDPETLARVFNPFWRADISDHTAKGMGLTVAQRLAQRFGWDIQLRSQPGHGTVAVLKFA